MSVAAHVVVALVALLHLYFLALEMSLRDKPTGLRAFAHTLEAAKAGKVLVANQGLYNGLLAAGLIWGLSLGSDGRDVTIFFLACALIAGLYGAATESRKILFVQALPAAIGLALTLLGSGRSTVQSIAGPRAFLVVTPATSRAQDRINAGVVQSALTGTAA